MRGVAPEESAQRSAAEQSSERGRGARSAPPIRKRCIPQTSLIPITLAATSLGLVAPILKDAGAVDRSVGQLTIAGASLGEVSAVVFAVVVLLGGVGLRPTGPPPVDARRGDGSHPADG